MRVSAWFVTVLVIFNFGQLNAATITKVKGKKVLIEFEDESLSVGEKYFAVNSDGKKKAIIKIVKVKANKAQGEVLKGKAVTDLTLEKSKKKTASKKSKSSHSGESDWAVGVMAGYGIDSMAVETTAGATTVTADLTGGGVGFLGVIDYKLFESLYVRAGLGLKSTSLEGTVTYGTGQTESYQLEVNFFTFNGMARYAFMDDDTKIWAGLGFGYYSASSTTQTTLTIVGQELLELGGSSAILIGAGADIPISDSMYVPLHVEYDLFIGNEGVALGSIDIGAGLMFKF